MLTLLLLLLAVGDYAHGGINEWTSIGPYGGPAYALAVHDSNMIYAGSKDGSIFRSTDSGSKWSLLNTDFGHYSVTTIKIDAAGVIYAGTDGDGIFKSTDGGVIWTAANSGLTDLRINSLLLAGAGGIFAGTAEGVFKSQDGGMTWVPLNSGFETTMIKALAIDRWGAIYAGTDCWPDVCGGVYRSSDGGSSWTNVSSGLKSLRIRTIVTNSQGAVFVGTCSMFDPAVDQFVGAGVYTSTDGGLIWTDTGGELEDVNVLLMDHFDTLYAGTSRYGVFKRIDGAGYWKECNSGITSYNIYDLAIDHYGWVYAVTNEGIFRSSDSGYKWTAANNGFNAIGVNSLTLDSMGGIYAGAPGWGVFRSIDNGDTWDIVNSGLEYPGYPSPIYGSISGLEIDSEDTLYAWINNWRYGPSIVCKSTNRGTYWNSIGYLRILDLSIDNNELNTIYAGTQGNGIYKTFDQGHIWNAINTGISTNFIGSIQIAQSGIVYASGWSDYYYSYPNQSVGGLFKSYDGGENWSRIFTGIEDSTYFCTIAVDPNDTEKVYVGAAYNGVLTSTDGGINWSNIGLVDQGVQSITVSPISL
jgi:photosystem II stability/assembly factor-like uncharacterized protein